MAIYERIAVCSDTTWNALSAGEQAEYDRHFNTWQGWLDHPWEQVDTLSLGHYEVIVWNDFGVLPRYEIGSSNYVLGNADNHIIYRAHSSARHNGIPGGGLKMNGMHNYYIDYVTFDGFEFDQLEYSDTTYQYFLNCTNNFIYFENCIISNLATGYYTLNEEYYKNCLFYQFGGYFRHGSATTKMINCGFYTTVAYTGSDQTCVSNGEVYNCWSYTENRPNGPHFGPSCTGDNNFSQDGSAPIAARPLSTFGFTDPLNGDFSITSSSPLYDQGALSGDETTTDIADGPRIQGAAIDIGPFELAVPTILELQGLVIGSAISVVDLDNGGFIVSPFVADTTTETMEFSLAAAVNVSVRVRNSSGTTKYLPWKSDFLLPPSGATLYVSQVEDTVAL